MVVDRRRSKSANSQLFGGEGTLRISWLGYYEAENLVRLRLADEFTDRRQLAYIDVALDSTIVSKHIVETTDRQHHRLKDCRREDPTGATRGVGLAVRAYECR